MSSSYSIWGALAETPWWIYMLFTWLLVVSWQATKPQIIHSRTAIVFPLTLMLLLYLCLPIVLKVTLANFSLLLMLIVPGFLLGFFQFKLQKIQAIKKTSQLYIRGSYSIFIFLLALLVIKFYYYNYSVNFSLSSINAKNNPDYLMMLIGFITGLFIARTWCLYRCLKFGPYKE